MLTFPNVILIYITVDVMVRFVFDEIEYVERIEQEEDLGLMKIIQQSDQL